MFSRRQPMPSARTIKWLYQLGYIASGTAAGLATLCLEEQRRRIKVLQKVADNAKIIRQHPRHRSNVAVLAEADGEVELNPLDRSTIEGRSRCSRRQRRKSVDRAQEGTIDESESTFAAEREFAGLFAGGVGVTKWPGPRNGERTASYGDERPRSAHVNSDPSGKGTSRPLPVKAGIQNSTRSLHSVSHKFAGQSATASPLLDLSAHPTLASIGEDSSGFLYPDRVSRRKMSDAHLFQSALDAGSTEEVRDICRWKLSRETFSQSDALAICNASRKLAQNTNREALHDLFAMVFNSDAFNSFTQSFRLEETIAVSSHMLRWNAAPQPAELRQKVLGDSRLRLYRPQLMEQLGKHCRDLLVENETSIASGLLDVFLEPDQRSSTMLSPIDTSFDDAIQNGRLEECMTFLRWKAISFGNDSIRMQLKPFIHACSHANEYGPLVHAFNSETGLGLSSNMLSYQLGVDSKVILAKAFLADGCHQADIRRLRRSLPRALRPALESLQTTPTLAEMWKTTRNFAHIVSHVSERRKQLRQSGDEKALHQLEEEVLDIYIEAGEVDRALAMVKTLHDTYGIGNITLCQSALALAKLGAWTELERLQEIMKKSESFEFEEETIRIFNRVILLHSRQHESKATWDFVADAIRNLGFTPTRNTTEIVLSSFVKSGLVELIPQWIAFMQQSGHETWVDAQMAALLLERYCVQHRPSHILVMWLCRKLVSLTPSLPGEPLIDLVKQSIAYDLRHLGGQYETWQRDQAEARLNRVEETKGVVPSPGFVWNDRLYFHDSDGEHDDTHKTTREVDLDDSKDVKRDMWLNMSLGQYQKVLDLYQNALDATGLPPKPDILETAVDASLHLHSGKPSHAARLIAQAREAGMNTSCADVPLFIHRVQKYPPESASDIHKLRKFVLEHYRKNEKNRWPVSHQLATTAANSLIIRGFPEQGVDLLRFIHSSHWGQERPFDEVTMAVMVRGYIACQNVEGVQWVVQIVLDQNIRISKPFMKHLKTGRRSMSARRNFIDMEEQFATWVKICNERRLQQMADTRNIGWKLVKCLAKSTKEGSTINVDKIIDPMEEYSIQGDGTDGSAKTDFNDESYFSDNDETVQDESHQQNDHYAVLKMRIDKDRKAEQEFRRQMKSIRWSHQEARNAAKAEEVNGVVEVELEGRWTEDGELVVTGESDNASTAHFAPFS